MCESTFSLQDKGTFEKLFSDYYATLVSYATTYTKREDVSEDIVQDLFVTLWENQRSFSSRAALRAYLYISVKNAALDYLKHLSVEDHYLHEAWLDLLGQVAADNTICKEEIHRRLFKLIDALPERCREIFLLHLDGKGNEEIARQLSLSIETVKTQKKRAMKTLREKWGNEWHDE